MRPGSLPHSPAGKEAWVEDTTWKVAYYRKDTPAQDPHDPASGAAMVNPWKLHLFSAEEKVANGFWIEYSGTGRSWVIAQPTMVYPSADRYFLEAAVQPEFDSEVGIIAAYQDNNNYLLFRWQPRDYGASDAAKAELLAVVNGEPKVLATCARGFNPGQWYTLRLNFSWQRVQALVDGTLLMDAANPGPSEGRIGLYAANAVAPRRVKLNDIDIPSAAASAGTPAGTAGKPGIVRFDNVHMGDWSTVQGFAGDSPYLVQSAGTWAASGEQTTAQTPGWLLTGDVHEAYYVMTSAVQLPEDGNAVLLFGINGQGDGYAWVLSPRGQQLRAISGTTLGAEITHSPHAVKPGAWVNVRVEADGAFFSLFCNDEQVMDHYQAGHTGGRCGIMAASAGLAVKSFTITPAAQKQRRIEIPERFRRDPSIGIWASSEAEWYPAFKPKNFIDTGWDSPAHIGPAIPARTDDPGLYWHKGGHYHNVYVVIPVSPQNLSGQVVYLATDYDQTRGYSLKLTKDGNDGKAQILRNGEPLGDYSFMLTRNTRIVFEHRGDFLILTSQEMDPEEAWDVQEVRGENLLAVLRDPDPLQTEMVGFQVTTSSLPAAQLYVESDRVQDTFHAAPVDWVIGSGTWGQMSRYACDPGWNWFGGYGLNIPTVWSKYRLDGNQTVEVYNAVKMQFAGAFEEYARRFRDLNMSICTDGVHLSSGYSLIRGGRPDGRPITMLLRKGRVVQTTTELENLVPGEGESGHHTWFAARMEKRGGEIKVFIDNHLAMTYVDADPLPGGYFAYWNHQ